MKTILFSVFLLFTVFSLNAQSRQTAKATVNKMASVPVFVYAKPADGYSSKGTITATWTFIASGVGGDIGVNAMARELIGKAKRKVKKGKLPAFDAIIINPVDFQGTLVTLKKKDSRDANVTRVSGVPIYLYSAPQKPYKKLKKVSANWQAISSDMSLDEGVSKIVAMAKKKEKKGKVPAFDAIIVNPDNYTGTLIKF